MAERNVRRKFLYEGAAARYRALMVKTSDPARRRMLEDMIARELETRRDLSCRAEGQEAAGRRRH